MASYSITVHSTWTRVSEAMTLLTISCNFLDFQDIGQDSPIAVTIQIM